MLQRLNKGDMVAIIPAGGATAEFVLEIAQIRLVGTGYIQLIDGRMYSSSDGRCMGSAHGGYAVIATDEHRAALTAKGGKVDEQS
jgi:hypothetical protein